MSKNYYYWAAVFALLCIVSVVKISIGFYFPENVQNTIIMIKDLQLSFFLIFVSYKLFSRKKRKKELIRKLNLCRERQAEYTELYRSGARDYVLEQTANIDKLIKSEYKLKKIESESDFIDNSIIWLTIIACILQIASFYGQKI